MANFISKEERQNNQSLQVETRNVLAALENEPEAKQGIQQSQSKGLSV